MSTDTKSYGDFDLDDFDKEGKTLRTELAELHVGERSASFLEDKKALLDRVNHFDTQYGLALREAARQNIRHIPGQNDGTGTIAAHQDIQLGEYRSGGDRLMESDGMRAWVDGGMANRTDPIIIELNNTSVDDFTMSGFRAPYLEYGTGGPGNNAASGVNSLLPVGQPIAPTPRQAQLFMRDLIPVQATSLTQVPYVRELTPTSSETGASTVAEGGTKPDTTDNFTPAVAYITVIAGNVSPSKQLWADAPVVVAYINQRLPYKVKFREDAEILNGNGTFPDIQGIRGTTGVQSQTATSGEFAITIGLALAKIENVDAMGTAVVMNPTDAWSMFIKRAAGGSGTFDAGTPFDSLPLTVWGLPTKRSRAYGAGEALVGDFAHGAMILDREQVNVQVYPQHSTYAASNQILVQCEERIGLAVWRPDVFVKAALS